MLKLNDMQENILAGYEIVEGGTGAISYLADERILLGREVGEAK